MEVETRTQRGRRVDGIDEIEGLEEGVVVVAILEKEIEEVVVKIVKV